MTVDHMADLSFAVRTLETVMVRLRARRDAEPGVLSHEAVADEVGLHPAVCDMLLVALKANTGGDVVVALETGLVVGSALIRGRLGSLEST